MARREPFANRLRDMPFPERDRVSPAAEYAGMLTDAGCRVDAWETVYIHELTGEHPVLDWIVGHGAAAGDRAAVARRPGTSSASS